MVEATHEECRGMFEQLKSLLSEALGEVRASLAQLHDEKDRLIEEIEKRCFD